MPDTLYLSSNGLPIGTLENRADVWRLTYDESWVQHPLGFPLSPHMALRREPYDDRDEDGLVQKFFDNLLPEGDARLRLAKRLHAEAIDTFDLLSKFGRETAGAVMVSASPELQPEDDRYNALPRAELLERVRAMRREGGSLLKAARMSLAGAQDKMAVRMAPSAGVSLMDGMREPVDQAPTTHILKPEPPTSRRLPHVAVNEFFCMSLARRLGVNVPEVHLLYAPGPDDDDLAWDAPDALEWVYCVRRFDRVESDSAAGITRIHQIDFLQLRNEWATTSAKYEKSSGAGMDLVFRLANTYASSPAATMAALVNQRLFSYLIGNYDAHWKNHSLMWNSGRWDVSPAYDLLSTAAYPDLEATPALTIGGCENEDRLEAGHLRTYFQACMEPYGAKLGALRVPLIRMAERALAHAPALYESIAPLVGESNAAFVHDKLLPFVNARARRAIELSRELRAPRLVQERLEVRREPRTIRERRVGPDTSVTKPSDS